MAKHEPIDWTMSDAPDEPFPADLPQAALPSMPPSPPRRAIPRRAWLLVAALPVLALVFVAVYARFENQRIRRQVEAAVAAQEQARLTGDWAALRDSFADGKGQWASQLISQLRLAGFDLPINLPGVIPFPEAGRVDVFQVLGPQQVRADVVRSFRLYDGTQFSFALPQYYQFAGGVWKQIAPPPAPAVMYPLPGQRVDVTYPAADAELAAGLAHAIDAVLAQACADWDCPPELRVLAVFHAAKTNFGGPQFDLLGHSLTLQTLLAHRSDTYPLLEVSLLTRPLAGYPADAAASEALQRAAGIQALLVAARQLAPATAAKGDNFYLDALVVREAVRLGLEAPRLAALQIANPVFEPDDLWHRPSADDPSGGAWLQALAILNQVLADRPLADERRLLHALDSASDVRGWLAAGLGLSPAEANARLEAAAAFDVPVPAVQAPAFTPDLALSCVSGVFLATLDGQSAPLFSSAEPNATFASWSPDGRRLALMISDRLAVVDLASGSGLWPAHPKLRTAEAAVWASNSVLAYPPAVWDDSGQIGSFQNSRIDLFDSAANRYLTQLVNASAYVRSPDGRWAVAGNLNAPAPFFSVIPALGGPAVLTVTNGYSAAWSPDSRQLAYATHAANGFSLVLADLAAGTSRTLLASGDKGVPPIPAEAQGWINLGLAWSPAGDRWAVNAYSYSNSIPKGWLGLFMPGSQELRLLPFPDETLPYMVAFSADGQFVAVNYLSEGGSGSAIYSAIEGTQLHSLPGYWYGAWSPAGHSLTLEQRGSLQLLRDPANPASLPERLGPAGCLDAAWKP